MHKFMHVRSIYLYLFFAEYIYSVARLFDAALQDKYTRSRLIIEEKYLYALYPMIYIKKNNSLIRTPKGKQTNPFTKRHPSTNANAKRLIEKYKRKKGRKRNLVDSAIADPCVLQF